MPVRLESSIERAVVEYGKRTGWVSIKLSTSGPRGAAGWPDRLFMRRGKSVFIEFKRPGGKATPLQQSRHDQLVDAGYFVFVVDDVNRGKGILDAH
jgi:Holliday junction resolvase